jgi:hypothetical protein
LTLFISYKKDYLNTLLPTQKTKALEIYNNDNNLNIYADNKEEFIKDKLIVYFKEKRVNRNVSLSYFNILYYILIFLNIL